MSSRLFLFLLFIFVFIVDIGACLAQNFTLKGRVVGNSQNNIKYVNALLLRSDSVIAGKAVTDSLGRFSIIVEKGNYVFVVEQFGVRLLKKDIFLNQDTDMGEIKINETVVLEGVAINGRRKLIERKVDRLVFNVEKSVYSSGTNVLDVLANTPLVSANDQGVSVIGKGSVKVMINDRILQMSNQELASYLRTLPSNDISKIEVITSPPAKYDAEGNSGLINIVTKKVLKDLFSGNLSTTFVKNSKESYQNNLGLNYNTTNFQSSLGLRHSDRNMGVYENQDVLFNTGKALNNHTDRVDNNKNLGVNIDMAFKTSKRNTIGLVYDYSNTRNTYESTNKVSYLTGSVLDSLLTTSSSYKNPSDIHVLSVYDDLVLDSIGSRLSFALNYFNNKPETNLEFVTNNTVNTLRVLNTSGLWYKVLSGQIDYALPAKWVNLESGLKFTRFDNNSDIKYLEFRDNQYELNNDGNNQFQLIEDNYAAYLSLNKNLNDYWTVKGGLRYEYTDLKSSASSGNTNYTTNYGKLFPTLNLMYKTNSNTYTLNYNKRINRPRLRQLNPFKWYSNPYIYIVGNPLLQPSISHNLEFNYLYDGMFTASVFGTQQENAFGSIIKIEEGIKETKMENIYTIRNLGLNMSFERDILSKWNLSVTTVGFYSKAASSYREVAPLEGWSANYSINNTFTISKQNSWLFFLNFRHILSGTESNVESRPLTNLTLGTRFNLFQDKLTFNLRGSDLLKGDISKGHLIYNDFVQYYNNYYDNRSFTASISYNFGAGKSSGRNMKFNDQYRAN
ncbi:outer membrane beta-barrel family protein [Pedobacter sp. PLR]|uniref:outer membrane beta-barrel family protein n=1 Tax=Pedobacter sp. PLR TaxID=2994465 RepID=UPI002245E6D3|nr:outer membrane beta-barrel family protein [Pedobacter sp. PLR]MCX2452019.1 outer membrane beta-barrel family protein [Pedobacter sp. PLR]